MRLVFEAKNAVELFDQIRDFVQIIAGPTPDPTTAPEKKPDHDPQDSAPTPTEDEGQDFEEVNPKTGKAFKSRRPRKTPTTKAEILPEPVPNDKAPLSAPSLVKKEAPKLTKDDTLSALKSLTAKRGMDIGKKLLTEFKAVRVSDIKPDVFQDFIDACAELENQIDEDLLS